MEETVYGVKINVLGSQKKKVPKTVFGNTYITKGTLDELNSLKNSVTELVVKHERYHQLNTFKTRKKTFLVFGLVVFIASNTMLYLIENSLLMSGVFSFPILVASFAVFSFSNIYESEIQADLFAAKELGREKAIRALETLSDSDFGKRLEHGIIGIFHKLTHPSLSYRLKLLKES
jgi:hypothetical protein